MTAMTITINGMTEVYEEISGNFDAVCLNDIQATPVMPFVIMNHIAARRNATLSNSSNLDYLNREIVKQDTTVTEFENFSPFGTLETTIAEYVPSHKEVKAFIASRTPATKKTRKNAKSA